ncbi:MAG: hypothetical protein QOJ42_7723 [Acidobacteriaceae bacterium]|nr:hypothetical protein [Acidobacteriaceae bacterium]
MSSVELGGSHSPRRQWCHKEPDFGSMGLGACVLAIDDFGNADDLVYEFATY